MPARDGSHVRGHLGYVPQVGRGRDLADRSARDGPGGAHDEDDREGEGHDAGAGGDAAEEVVAPAMPAECLLDRNALIMGYSGVYSSFLKHAIRQSERYGVPAHKLLHRAGQRKLIGGQEDQLIDIALEIKREQDAAGAPA